MKYEEARKIAIQTFETGLKDQAFPQEWKSRITLSGHIEPDQYIFELYLPANEPENAQVLAKVKVFKNGNKAEFINSSDLK